MPPSLLKTLYWLLSHSKQKPCLTMNYTVLHDIVPVHFLISFCLLLYFSPSPCSCVTGIAAVPKTHQTHFCLKIHISLSSTHFPRVSTLLILLLLSDLSSNMTFSMRPFWSFYIKFQHPYRCHINFSCLFFLLALLNDLHAIYLLL